MQGGGVMIAMGGPNTPALQVLPPDAMLGGGEMGTIMPVPKGPKGRATPIGAVVAVVNKSSANADIAADFVKDMLGTISVDSVPGQGSCFRVHLPPA